MKQIPQLCFIVATVASLIPVNLIASKLRMPPPSYDSFTLTPEDKLGMLKAPDKACIARAMGTPNDVRRQTACYDALIIRLSSRVDRAMYATTPRSNSPRERQFKADQRTWATTYKDACDTKWREELNPSSNSFGLAVSQCIAQETYRRALWIERFPR
jgi:hypothetical protein